MAALVLTNLLYLVGAVAVASLVSGLYVLRHRKPKSVESGIESFSRELRALAPEQRGGADRSEPVSPSDGPRPPGLRAGPTARSSGTRRPTGGSVATKTGRRVRADAPAEPEVSGRPDAGMKAGNSAPGSPGVESPSPSNGEAAGGPELTAQASLSDASPALESRLTDETLPPDDGDGQASEGRGG